MRPAPQPPRLPPHGRGLRIGLFGGSFNPPHEGHALVAETALRRLRLDRVWWLVTPGNPLKENSELPSQAQRMAACRRLASDPRMIVTGIEAQIGTVFTQQTVAWLKKRCPGVRFVWIMGGDSLIGFHRWQRWRAIVRSVPVAVVDRPGATLKAGVSPAARAFQRSRLREAEAPILAACRPPAWVFLHGPRSQLSSTALRKARNVAKTSANPG